MLMTLIVLIKNSTIIFTQIENLLFAYSKNIKNINEIMNHPFSK